MPVMTGIDAWGDTSPLPHSSIVYQSTSLSALRIPRSVHGEGDTIIIYDVISARTLWNLIAQDIEFVDTPTRVCVRVPIIIEIEGDFGVLCAVEDK